MITIVCPYCGHGWQSAAKTRTRCGGCGKAVTVPRELAVAPVEEVQPADFGLGYGLGAAALCLIAGVWMIHRARTRDPRAMPDANAPWRWVAGGVVCIGASMLLGYVAVRRAMAGESWPSESHST
jgi:hypothetical protein